MRLRIEITGHVPASNQFDGNYASVSVGESTGPPALRTEVETEDSRLVFQQADSFLRSCLGQFTSEEEKIDALKEESKRLKDQVASITSRNSESMQRLTNERIRLDKFIAFCADHTFPADSARRLKDLLDGA